MELNDEQLDQITAWFAHKGLPACSCVPESEGALSTRLFAAPVINPGGHLALNEVLPLVVITCSSCCRVTFYNAKKMGLMD